MEYEIYFLVRLSLRGARLLLAPTCPVRLCYQVLPSSHKSSPPVLPPRRDRHRGDLPGNGPASSDIFSSSWLLSRRRRMPNRMACYPPYHAVSLGIRHKKSGACGHGHNNWWIRKGRSCAPALPVTLSLRRLGTLGFPCCLDGCLTHRVNRVPGR